LNSERRVILFSPTCPPPSLPLPTLTSSINTFLFSSQIDRVGNGYRISRGRTGWTCRLEVGRKGLRKTWGNLPKCFYGCIHSLFCCKLCCHGTAKHHYLVAYSSLHTITDSFSTAGPSFPSSLH
jgi:hypothetical protein